jgi:MYXO-CTERM domain-containing protein
LRGLQEGRNDVVMNLALRRLALATALGVTASLTTASAAFGQGATTPFVTYEAEEGSLGGGATVRALAAPLLSWSDTPEAEASGRAFVQRQNTGDALTLPNNTGGNVTAIDFRYSIPDAPAGGGITSTLNLYVDGVFRQSLYVSSKQTWLYSGTTGNNWDGMSQDPSIGNPHIFFEEGHAFISGPPVAPGSKITFQKDAANTASFYWIDCVDLENPAPPLTQPTGSISITDNGAVATTLTDPIPGNAVDSTNAIQKTINAASAQGKSVWIPQGRFIVTGGLTATCVTIEGAGMWYSAVYRNLPLPVTNPLATMWQVTSVTMRNFLIDSNSQSRTNADGDAGGITVYGASWLVENMWVQHCSSGVWGSGSGGTARNCRMLSTWGDGININNSNTGGTGNNLTVENNYVRGVGDDGVTINSDVTSAQMQNPTLKNNTTVSVYWAHGLGVYGGNNDLVQDNLLCDPANFPGMVVGVFNGAPLQSGIVQGNVIVRGGGDAYNQHQAALEIGSGAPGSGTIGNVQFLNNVIIDSMQKAVELTSGNSITFANNVIDGLWVNSASPSSIISAIDVVPNVTGSATFTSNTLQDLLPGQVTFVNASPSGFQTSGMGNVGFDPTASGPTLWTSGSDAGAARRTASCTTPVSLVLGDAGAPDAGSGSGSGGDAGAAGGSAASGGGGGAGSSSTGSGTGGAAGTPQKSSGCSCRITESRMPPATLWALALASLAMWRRRRG